MSAELVVDGQGIALVSYSWLRFNKLSHGDCSTWNNPRNIILYYNIRRTNLKLVSPVWSMKNSSKGSTKWDFKLVSIILSDLVVCCYCA